MAQDDRLIEARKHCEAAVFSGAPDAADAADRLLDGVEADLALLRGRALHTRFLADRSTGADPRELEYFERALSLYQRMDDAHGKAEAAFYVGLYHQVVKGDDKLGMDYLRAALGWADDPLIRSYVLRHMGFANKAAGDVAGARVRFEESLRLRREAGFAPGVAAGLLVLAILDAEEGDYAAARAGMDEAEIVARACAAHGTLKWIKSAKEELESSS